MYQSIGIKNLLTVACLLAILVFITLTSIETVDSIYDYLKRASLSATVAGLLIYLVGQTPFFPLFCKLPVVRAVFPPIDGDWEVTLESNWGEIKKLRGLENEVPSKPVMGVIKIKARLLSVHLSFQSKNSYSTSKTVCVGVSRDANDSSVQLNYIYKNKTAKPEPTDSPTHNGAARVEIVADKTEGLLMSGTYWTDRKWVEGMNTAGRITFRRVGRAL